MPYIPTNPIQRALARWGFTPAEADLEVGAYQHPDVLRTSRILVVALIGTAVALALAIPLLSWVAIAGAAAATGYHMLRHPRPLSGWLTAAGHYVPDGASETTHPGYPFAVSGSMEELRHALKVQIAGLAYDDDATQMSFSPVRPVPRPSGVEPARHGELPVVAGHNELVVIVGGRIVGRARFGIWEASNEAGGRAS